MEKGISKLTNREFSIAGELIENVKSYKYLGFMINYNGSFKQCIEDRMTKATKCVYAIRNAISHHTNISTRLANTIFNRQVSPILTYGCPLWIMPKANNSLDISMRLDRYANIQVKRLLENTLDKPVNITKSTIDRTLSKVSVTLGNWEDKQSILNVIP